MAKPDVKRFIVRKYIFATCAQDALKKEKSVLPDDVWLDEQWKAENDFQSKKIGYK